MAHSLFFVGPEQSTNRLAFGVQVTGLGFGFGQFLIEVDV